MAGNCSGNAGSGQTRDDAQGVAGLASPGIASIFPEPWRLTPLIYDCPKLIANMHEITPQHGGVLYSGRSL